jgi:GT2 family glycosyltransferase/glycosyltransferase involved in cell wall biosynthesis
LFSETLFPFSRHLVRVRTAADKVELGNSPFVLAKAGTNFDPAVVAYLERAIDTEIIAARSPDDLDAAVSFLAEQLAKVAVARLTRLEQREGLANLIGAAVQEAGKVVGSEWGKLLTKNLTEDYPPVLLTPTSDPLISIVIPAYNNFAYTYGCIAALADQPTEFPFETILVDDCSEDETLLAPLVFGGSVAVYRNERNLGFLASCNRGAASARGKFIVFLNNDTLVHPGWLDALTRTFDDVPDAGIVGSKLLFPDGKLQEAGGIVWRMADAWNWGRDADPGEPRFCFLRDADYVSAASLMIRKDLFAELGGFDPHFAPAYYEDTDLCFRAAAAGRRVLFQPKSEVTHFEGISAGREVTGRTMKRYQAVNHRKFYERWRHRLVAHRMNGDSPDLEAERRVTKRAIFVDDSVPTPDQDAGSVVAKSHMLSLMRLGYKVVFLPGDNMARIEPYTSDLERIGVECPVAPYFGSVESYVKRQATNSDIVYLHRYANAFKYAGLIRYNSPKSRIIYNVADLHFLRQQREAEVKGEPRLLENAADVKRMELAAMRLCDAVIVHSSAEAELLRQEAADLESWTVPWSVTPSKPVQSFTFRSGLLFVGGYRHPPNVDAALWLVKAVMPLVWSAEPSIMCQLAGSNMPETVKELQSGRVKTLGQIPSLKEVYNQVRLTVAPLRFGAGIKGKVIESFANGVPCVMTPIASEGLALSPLLRKTLVASKPEEFANRIVELHNDVGLLQNTSAECIRFVTQNYCDQSVDDALRSCIFG